MEEDGQDVAREKDKYHQRVHPHPLHGEGRPPQPVQVDQGVDPGEEEPCRTGRGQSVTYSVQWFIHTHSKEVHCEGQY